MSTLSDLTTFINGNATITAAIPASSIWTGVAPEGTPFPIAVITPVSKVPSYTTTGAYYETFTFQVDVYSYSDSQAEAVAQAFINALNNNQAIASNVMTCLRTNYVFMTDEQMLGQNVYRVTVTFDLWLNQTLP